MVKKVVTRINPHKIQLLVLIAMITIAFSSCRVSLISNYDASIATQIEQTASQIEKFYLMMLETTSAENEERSFDKFATQYVDIEVELNSLLTKNKLRSLNENSIKICKNTLTLWRKYKNEHKTKNSLSDGKLKINKLSMSDILFAMLVAEKAKDISNKPS